MASKRKRESTSPSGSESGYELSTSSGSYDSSSSSSSECLSESDHAGVQETRVTNLSFNQVLAHEYDVDSDDAYQTNGKSKDRLREALRSKCCSKQCKRGFSMKMVLPLVTAFWSLTKSGQDTVLWSLQHPLVEAESGDDDTSSDSETISSRSSNRASRRSRNQNSRRGQTVGWHVEGTMGLVRLRD